MIHDKIIKLLRLAERGTGAEAELALAHAQRMAIENQIDLATIDTNEGETSKKEEFIETAITDINKRNLRNYVLWLLHKHFRVAWVINGGRTIQILGRRSDVVFAEYLFHWLTNHFTNEWKRELKKPRDDSMNGRRRTATSFFYGMYSALDEKLKQARKQAEESKLREVAVEHSVEGEDIFFREHVINERYQLSIVNEADELEREYNKLHPKVRVLGMRVNSRGVSMAAGRLAGNRTTIPGIPLNNSFRSALS